MLHFCGGVQKLTPEEDRRKRWQRLPLGRGDGGLGGQEWEKEASHPYPFRLFELCIAYNLFR